MYDRPSSVNFYRSQFFNDKNRELVECCKSGDTRAILQHLFEQDRVHPHRYDDEFFENRYGMQRIFETIKFSGGSKWIIDIACGKAELLKRLATLGHNVVGIDLSPVRFALNRAEVPNLILGCAENVPLSSNTFDFIIAQDAWSM